MGQVEIRKMSCQNKRYFQYYRIIVIHLFYLVLLFWNIDFFVLALLTCMTKHKFKHYGDGYIQNCHTFCEKSGPNSSLPEPYKLLFLSRALRLQIGFSHYMTYLPIL